MFIDYNNFIKRVRGDVSKKHYDKNHLELIMKVVGEKNPKLLEYLKRESRKPGQQRLFADCDHIIPREVWALLMPHPLDKEEYVNVVSNLQFRDIYSNRSFDQKDIKTIQEAHAKGALSEAEKRRWVTQILRVKKVEGSPQPIEFNDLRSVEGKIKGILKGGELIS